MKQLLDLMSRIRSDGRPHMNRTGVDTLRISGAHLQFNLEESFPAVTTKKLEFGSVAAELLCFLRGERSAAAFRANGTRIWDANANENGTWKSSPHRLGRDDLGRVYGVQWRDWRDSTGKRVDQLRKCLATILSDPDSRRNIVTAWNPGEITMGALPPCHLLWQAMPDRQPKKLDLCVYIRSWDVFLGAPFNIASYALLTHLLAQATGYKARTLNVFAADAHLYVNHLEQVGEQLAREPHPGPQLVITSEPEEESPLHWLTNTLELGHIQLVNYHYHPAIKAPMAV